MQGTHRFTITATTITLGRGGEEEEYRSIQKVVDVININKWSVKKSELLLSFSHCSSPLAAAVKNGYTIGVGYGHS